MPGLRVISGAAGGLLLQAVPGDKTRPITDRTKEALFNIIRQDLPASHFLDLFAGTGSVGIEALSRGADFVRFLDTQRVAIETIQANLNHTKLGDKAEVVQTDALGYLTRKADRHFDYVYVAPPQYHQLWSRALTELDANTAWLVEDAWVIAQIHPKEYEELQLKNLQEFDQRKYGNTLLVFYEHLPSS